MLRYVCGRTLHVLILINLLLVGCGKQSVSPQVSGSPVAATSAYPATVLLGISTTGICTATIIGAYVAMTAAHCVDTSNNPADYRLKLSDGRTVQAIRIETTGGADVESTNDLALLIFRDRLAGSSDEICNIDPMLSVGDDVIVVGFGTNNNIKRSGSGVKRAGENKVYAMGSFVELQTTIASTESRSVIGSSTDAGSGFGDSGGGLRKKNPRKGQCSISAVVHAGGMISKTVAVSEFVRLDGENLDWLRSVIARNNLEVEIL